MIYPNGTETETAFKPSHVIGIRQTKATNSGEVLDYSSYDHNERDFVTGVSTQEDKTGYAYDDREQLNEVTTPEGDIIRYEYDGAGNRTVRKAIIQGAKQDKQQEIDIEQIAQMVLGKSLEDLPGDSGDGGVTGDSGAWRRNRLPGGYGTRKRQ